MRKLWTGLAIGVLLGAVLMESFHRVTDARSRERFEMNLRCKKLADDYVRKGSGDYSNVMLNEVRFSPARNECVASVIEVSQTPPSDTWRYTVLDVLSGKEFFSDLCVEDKKTALYCGDGRNIDIIKRQEKAFEDAVD